MGAQTGSHGFKTRYAPERPTFRLYQSNQPEIETRIERILQAHGANDATVLHVLSQQAGHPRGAGGLDQHRIPEGEVVLYPQAHRVGEGPSIGRRPPETIPSSHAPCPPPLAWASYPCA